MSNFDTLIIGDLHATPSNLEDTGLVLDRVNEVLQKNPTVSQVIFLGDIFHTHSVLRQEVAHFVQRKIILMYDNDSMQRDWYLMAGNHDGHTPFSVEKNSVRLVFGNLRDDIYVVDNENQATVPYQQGNNDYCLVPFMGDSKKFVDNISGDLERSKKILFCHQTVTGAHYENKHLAIGGIDQELIPQEFVVAGHIHMQQTVGKVWYPGTPRALTANESNQSKGIWLFNTKTLDRQMITTDDLVKLFIRYDIEEGKASPAEIETATWKKKDDVRIYVTGSETFYEEVLSKYYEKLKGKAKFVPNIRKDLSNVLNVEADGENMHTALHSYVFKIYDADKVAKEKVWQKLQNLIPNLGSNA